MGVDPGIKGGWCRMEDGDVIVGVLPYVDSTLNMGEFLLLLRSLAPDMVMVEAPLALPKMSHHGSLSFGRAVGQIEGIVVGSGTPMMSIHTKVWKSKILAGTDKSKEAAIRWVSSRYPSVRLVLPGCRKPHDGIADAVCIAEYARGVL